MAPVIHVDKYQISSPDELYVLARKSARLMGPRLRKPTDEQWERKVALFDGVMTPTRAQTHAITG